MIIEQIKKRLSQSRCSPLWRRSDWSLPTGQQTIYLKAPTF